VAGSFSRRFCERPPGPLDAATPLSEPGAAAWREKGGASAHASATRVPAERYQRDRPGELIQVDAKELGAIGGGWRVRGRGDEGIKSNQQRGARVQGRSHRSYLDNRTALDDRSRLAHSDALDGGQ